MAYGIVTKKYIPPTLSLAILLCCVFWLLQCTGQATGPDQEIESELLEHEIISDELVIPWQMGFAPDGRIFISERNGLIRIVEDGMLQEKPWVSLRDSILTKEGVPVTNSGVMGLALDPDFEVNRFVYIGYTYDAPGKDYDYNRLVRFTDQPESGTGTFDAVLMDSVKGLSMHNTAQIRFGPDDKLYWSISERHEIDTAQNLDDLGGSLLRMNTDGTIPADNPFPGSYIYAYGLRNTQGFDWHPDTGQMLATDHGPSGAQGCCHDEVNVIEPGKNYGWPVIRGSEEKAGMESPLIHSGVGTPHEDYTWAPSGARFLHSGPWRGDFLFAGLRSQSLWQLSINQDDGEVSVNELNRHLEGVYGRIRSVEQGPDGDIYIITSNLDQHDVPFDKDYLVRISVKE